MEGAQTDDPIERVPKRFFGYGFGVAGGRRIGRFLFTRR